MTVKHISAKDAQRLVENGALLVDIREAGEYAAENIPGARNVPMSGIGSQALDGANAAVVFHCKSGARTRLNAAILANCTDADVYVLDGGIEAWKAAGLPVRRT